MKKNFLKKTITAIFLTAVALTANAGTPIIDGDYWKFEVGTLAPGGETAGVVSANWWIQHPTVFTVVNDGPASTTGRCLKFSSTGSAPQAFVQSSATVVNNKITNSEGAFWVETPGRYALEFDLYIESGTLNPNGFLMVSPGEQVSPNYYGVWIQANMDVSEAKTGQWVRVRSSFFQNAGNTTRDWVKSVLRFNYTANAAVTFYVDNIAIYEEKELPMTYGSTEQNNSYFGFELPNQGTQPQQQAQWWIADYASFSVINTEAHSGTRCLQFKSESITTAEQQSSSLTAYKAARVYVNGGGTIVKAWVKKVSGDFLNAFRIDVKEDNNNPVFKTAIFNCANLQTGVWTLLEADLVNGAGDIDESPMTGQQIQVRAIAGTQATFLVDDIQFVPLVPNAVKNTNQASIKVIGKDNKVTVIGAAGKSVKVTNLMGQILMQKQLRNDYEDLSIDTKGVVLVNVDREKAVKAILK